MSRRQTKAENNLLNYGGVIPQNTLKTNPTEIRQYVIVSSYFKLLEQLAVARFAWQGLPDEIDERFLELSLFEAGGSPLIFYYDKIRMKFVVTRAAVNGQPDMYGNPLSFKPIAVNYNYPTVSARECVPIYDNQLRMPMTDVLYTYATRLARVDRSIDINLDNAVFPMIIVTTEAQKLSVMNILKQAENGQPKVIAYDNLDPSTFSGIPANTPYVTDKLLQAKAQIWNEAVNFLGINNSQNEKKERMITDEMEAGAERTDVFRLSFLKARQQACDQINRMYGHMGILVGIDWANNTTPATIGGDSEGSGTGD
jgi:hypothetical protein